MTRTNTSATSEHANTDVRPENGDDGLLLIDDASFVRSYAEACNRLGQSLVCIRCFDPTQALRALVLLLERREGAREIRGGLGLCRECYRDLTELRFHDAVLRASTASGD